VYLERRILASIHNNDAYFDFSAIIGWKHLGGFSPPWLYPLTQC
jgi:hypothetical protein